tara:strand:- start:8576 stop:9427 length:852 start_codon:yes stop_codon:yes gene_type:complete
MESMKKFIWLASYPKSGNTMVRLFLSAYFFTKDGIIRSFDTIKHIINFQSIILELPNCPSYEDFKNSLEKVYPLWIEAQKYHAQKINKAILLKTHCFVGKACGYSVTNNQFTKGFIYIVRDPRSVAISSMHHFNLTTENSVKMLLDDNKWSFAKGAPAPEIISSWKNNYLSWKNFSSDVPSLILKYEEIIESPKTEYLKILFFLQNIMEFEIDSKKFNNALKSVDFINLKNLEKKEGFDENTSKSGQFFRKGIKDDWKEKLPKNLQLIIENKFSKEMSELNYI